MRAWLQGLISLFFAGALSWHSFSKSYLMPHIRFIWIDFLKPLIQFIALVLLSASLHASDDAIYLDVQSGSLMGLLHASAGYEFSERHHVMGGLGYVPKLDDHREMALASIRYRYQHPFHWNMTIAKKDWVLKPLNFGVGLLYANHDDLFVALPDQYPDGYYGPTGLRAIFNYQAIVQVDQALEVYLDISVMDFGLAYYIREPDFFYENYDFLGLDGITNWGVGMRYRF